MAVIGSEADIRKIQLKDGYVSEAVISRLLRNGFERRTLISEIESRTLIASIIFDAVL
jgi:hypothetical protein